MNTQSIHGCLRLAGGLFAVLSLTARAQAPEQSPEQSPCVDRISAETPAPRISELTYRCLQLQNGRHVLVGEAGGDHPEAVLLVHGLGNNAHRDWRLAVPVLAEHFRVIALDLPGFGASPGLPRVYTFDNLAAVLAEVLDRYAAPRAHVVGHSLGGALSLYFAHVNPQRVDRLVLVDAAGILHKSMFVRHIAEVNLPDIGVSPVDRLVSAVDRRINSVSRLLLRKVDSGPDFSAWLVENPLVRRALFGNFSQTDAAIGLVEQDFSPAIRNVTAPTTLIWGRDDPIAPLRTGELLAARMIDARLRVFDDVGHVPMNESAARFNAVLFTALSQPLPPKFEATLDGATHANVECANRTGAQFSGTFASLTLKNCVDARIERAQIGQLVMESSSATIKFAAIEHPRTPLIAKNSRLSVTAATLRGATVIENDGSELDMAGVTLLAARRTADVRAGGRIYFSVSEIASPDYIGDAHFIWTEASLPAAPADASSSPVK